MAGKWQEGKLERARVQVPKAEYASEEGWFPPDVVGGWEEILSR